MDNKIPNVEFDKDKVELGPNTNLSVDQFDSKQRQIDLSIKKQKHLFLVIKNFALVIGVIFSWATVIWSVCSLNHSMKHYVELITLYEHSHEKFILWMYGLSICSLTALVITLCLTLTRIFVRRKSKVVPKTAMTAFLEELKRKE